MALHIGNVDLDLFSGISSASRLYSGIIPLLDNILASESFFDFYADRFPQAVKRSFRSDIGKENRFVNSRVIADTIAEYYNYEILKNGFTPYSASINGRFVKTSMLVSGSSHHNRFDPAHIRPDNNIYMKSRNVAFEEIIKDKKFQKIRRRMESYYKRRHKFQGRRISNDKLYRISPENEFHTFEHALCNFIEYRYSYGILEDEIKTCIASCEGDAARAARKLRDNSLRNKLLPSLSAMFSADRKVCCGGIEITTALARREDDDFYIPIQWRSEEVSDGQGHRALIPKGWYQPHTYELERESLEWTVLRELFEELYGGAEDVGENTPRETNFDYWVSDEKADAIRWLLDNRNSWSLIGTGFGINAVAGNFEFFGLLVVFDVAFYERFARVLSWESSGIEGISSRLPDRMEDVLCSSSERMVNECIPGFIKSLSLLHELEPNRVKLPSIVERVEW